MYTLQAINDHSLLIEPSKEVSRGYLFCKQLARTKDQLGAICESKDREIAIQR